MTKIHRLPLVALLIAATTGIAGAAGACVGDCNDNGAVSINELVLGVNIASDLAPLDECLSRLSNI